MENFLTLGLPEALTHTLTHMQFNTPTPIQAQAIPPALEGKDILGSAQTGTGKTGAFGIPLVARLMASSRGSALVMTPTRELAVQVMDQLEKMLGKRSNIKSALLIGGEPMPKQLQQLRNRPRLLVGTPGRINDHLERGSLMLHDATFLVLDETDRMLDMGFSIQIERIMKFMPKQRQTLLFSATLPQNIVKIANTYLTNPVRVSAGEHSKPATNLKQDVINLSEDKKYDALVQQLNEREGSVIIFVKTKWGAEKMAQRLSRSHHVAEAIHGDLRQNKRDRVIAGFRNRNYRIMVATDIAARGLDIPHIEHVINYDLPQSPEDYIHRIGRTARAGAEGSALCFVTPSDKGKWRAIQRMLNPDAKPEDDYSGESRGPRKGSGKPRRSFGGGGQKPRSESRDGEKRRSADGRNGENRGGERRSAEGRSGESRGGERRSVEGRTGESRGGERRSAEARNGENRGGDKARTGSKPRSGGPRPESDAAKPFRDRRRHRGPAKPSAGGASKAAA